jgi:hypothetical protein
MRELLPVQRAPFQVSTLARVPLNQLELLPAASGIYLGIDDANRVWYVGLARSLRDRLKTHERMPDFRTRGVTLVAWKEFEEENCQEVETAAIQFFGPPLNLQNNVAFPCSATGLSPDEEIERFLRLKFEQRWIDLELEALKPNIVSHCLQAGGEVKHMLGTLRTRPYPSWQFSPAVDGLQDRLRQLKQQEQENGVATRTEKTVPYAILSRDVLASEIAIHLTPFLESEADDEQAAGTAEGM